MIVTKIPELNTAKRDMLGGALVTDLSDEITAQAEKHGVSPDLIGGVIRHESGAIERRAMWFLADPAEFVQAWFDSDASIGILQREPSEAKIVEQLGYVAPKGDVERILALLDHKQAVEYTAAYLQYVSDNLNKTYGNQFSNLSDESRSRLILIGYNQRWGGLKSYIDKLGMAGTIKHFNYDRYTYDDYYRWKNRKIPK